jgi:PTH1 family peptidyl-tRNA hydrolase
MKLLVGLGNPGVKYKNNRHNVGFMLVDYLAANKDWKQSNSTDLLYLWISLNNEKIELVKPQSYMNKSGQVIKSITKKHPELKLNDLVVVHDDLDIPLGKFKIQQGEGPQLHNGINSIERALGTNNFWRIRVGVDNRSPDNRIDGETYVLQDFLQNELDKLPDIFDRINLRLNQLWLKR